MYFSTADMIQSLLSATNVSRCFKRIFFAIIVEEGLIKCIIFII